MRFFAPAQLEAQRKPLFPHKIISGSLPGATEIRIGGDQNIKISGKDQQISISTDAGTIEMGRISATRLGLEVTNTDGSSSGIGIVPGTLDELGFFSTDINGSVVWKQLGPTGYIFDLVNSVNIMQDGKLPDGTYGSVVAKEGVDVPDVFS